MNKIYIITLIFFLFSSVFSKAEVVKKIEINGNKRVGEETVKVYGEIKDLNSNFTQIDLDNILKNLYSTNFFEDIDVKISNNVLIINLKEYPLINEIILIGEKKTSTKKEIKNLISLKEKNSFIKNNLNNDINLIKELYSTLGYKFAKINSKVRKIDENNYDIAIEIKKGELTRIKKIFFTGDKKIKEKRLRDIIASEEDQFWKVISKNSRFSENQVDLDKRLLFNYYRNLGYYDVKINSTSAEIINSEKVNLYFSIDAGERYIFEKIETVVDPTFDKKIFYPLKKTYSEIVGDYYSPLKIKKVLEEIDTLIDNNKLQFVEHSVQESLSGKKINLKFDIREGRKIIVERINVKGNSVTNESVIRSELLLDEGDPFTNLSLEKSVSKLKARNIFKSVNSETLQGSSSDLKVINITVEEKPTGEISAGAGVGTNGGSFAFNIQENNWLGDGKIVGLDFEVNKESLKGRFTYSNPNYDLLGNSMRYYISNQTNDMPDQGYENSVLSLGASTGFEQYNDVYTNLGFNISYDDLRTTSAASSSLKKQAGDFLEFAANYGFSYDQRDRSFMPTDAVSYTHLTLPTKRIV